MKRVRMVAMIVLGMSVSGCATLDVASRNAPFEAPQAAAVAPSMKVESFQVRVPQSLKVSEANLYYPSGDIVWRGEPLGDRRAQVQKIFEDSLSMGVQGSNGQVPVLLDIEVTRFHALTEKARYTVGGIHSLGFTMNFLDPETRQPVAPARKIKADLKAFGGARAIHAEQNGITQKYRITHHLAGVVQRELGIDRHKPAPEVTPIPVPQVSRNATPLAIGDRTSGLF